MNKCFSLSQLANELNNAGVRTVRGKEWTKASVAQLSKRHELGLGHIEQPYYMSGVVRTGFVKDFAKELEKGVLRYIDMSQDCLTIAKELNSMGVKTRTGGKWGNVAVQRLKNTLEK